MISPDASVAVGEVHDTEALVAPLGVVTVMAEVGQPEITGAVVSPLPPRMKTKIVWRLVYFFQHQSKEGDRGGGDTSLTPGGKRVSVHMFANQYRERPVGLAGPE